MFFYRLLLGNGSINTFPWQQIRTQEMRTLLEVVFLYCLCRGYILLTLWRLL
jgi:hypothetical protein